MAVKSFEWVDGSHDVCWVNDDGKVVGKHYKYPVRSACMLSDESGAAIIEPYEEVGMRNAVIYNLDGSERVRLELPVPETETYGFYCMYYEEDILLAVVTTIHRDVAVTVNPDSGECNDLHETR